MISPRRSGLPRDPAFVLPAVALLAALVASVCAALILGRPGLSVPPAITPGLSFEHVPPPGVGIEWSADAVLPADAERRALERLTVTTLVFIGLVGLVALLGVLGLWREESIARRPGVAIQRAVGATRRQLFGERLAETLTVAGAASALAVAIAVALYGWIRATWPGGIGASLPEALLLAAGVGAATACVATFVRAAAFSTGLMPGAVLDTETSLVAMMTEEQGHPLLSVVQISFVTAVLTTGLVMLTQASSGQRIDAVERVEPGQRLELVRLGAESGVETLIEGLREGPVARAAAFAHVTSPGAAVGLGVSDRVLVECPGCLTGRYPTPLKRAGVVHHLVTPDTFRAFDLDVLEGRALRASDGRGAAPVAVVSRSFMTRIAYPINPVGRGVEVGEGLGRWYTIVGVVEDRPRWSIGAREQPPVEVYLSALQHDAERVELLLPEAAAADGVLPAVRVAGWAVVGAGPLADHLSTHRARSRWFGGAWTVLSGAALLMAIFGLFSTMRLIVLREIREIGVRRAVGARRSRILRRYLGVGTRLGGAGVAVGLWLSMFAIPQLPAPPALDRRLALLVLVGVVLPVLSATLAGVLAPAWRAARAQPHDAIEGIVP